MSIHSQNKIIIAGLSKAFLSGKKNINKWLLDNIRSDAKIRFGEPFQRMIGPKTLWNEVYANLLKSISDFNKRDFLLMAGPRWGKNLNENWVGVGGNFMGTFSKSWLNIPPTGKLVFMRYHEYYRFKEGQVLEMECLWDIPQLMMQAGVWKMAPQLGIEFLCPGPSDGKGIINTPHNSEKSNKSVQVVWNMLHKLKQGDAENPEKGLGEFWHENAWWYGPTGIGAARGPKDIVQNVLKGFRQGLSNNVRRLKEGVFFGDQNIVAFTGWPSGIATHSGEGFLGLRPTGKRFMRRSLDFWRIENNLIVENWVMVDMIHTLSSTRY